MPSYELPPPPSGEEIEHDKAMETRQFAEAAAGKQQPQLAPPAATTATVAPPAQPLPAPPAQPAAQSTPTDDDIVAADVELIEKAWVEKAKAVVARTKDDPHLQKSEMSKIKADYIKKRYKKVIPTEDGAPAPAPATPAPANGAANQ